MAYKVKEIYVLITQKHNCCCGVYTSLKQLRLGVDYYIKLYPNETLAYYVWKLNYPPEPEEWNWCYIHPGENRRNLTSGGGNAPKNFLWGQNLVGIEWWNL